MSRLILINRRLDERRVALIENGITAELFFEPVEARTVVGNIYQGRVVRVMPGMQAAFVELGLARTGFLFVGDLAERRDEDGQGNASRRADAYPPIDTLVKAGQSLLLQVAKEPIGTKGARVTRHISLPGRHLVYTPSINHVGVSRRITAPAERQRLVEIAEELKPERGGLIIRTVAEGLDRADLEDDLDFLLAVWEGVERRASTTAAPALIHADMDLTLRSVRDLLHEPGDRVVVDDLEEFERIHSFIANVMPEFAEAVELYSGRDPMFEHYGVEWEISRAVRRKVWLRCGGSIVIDKTEALTAIDVNTGRFVGRRDFSETVLEANLEAVKEIAYQLRLRDIGGIIVVDFIDMHLQEHRQRVTDTLEAALVGDKARTHVLPMSELGLIAMTRKRVRNSIVEALEQPCHYCSGTGTLKSIRIIVDSVFGRLRQEIRNGATDRLKAIVHPRVAETIAEARQDAVTSLEREYGVELEFVADPDVHLEEFQVV